MCDIRGHEHWCSACSKNLNNEPKDSYIEIEWSQDDKGRIVEDKSMICKECLEKSDSIKELNEFFSDLQYPPFGHVFCSSCKKDLTKEYKEKAKEKTEEGVVKKIKRKIEEKFEDIPKPGIDYECLSFKYHERSGPNIKHIIKVVVLCHDCIKKEFNAENIGKLKKLGKNPLFKPKIECPNTDICKQFKNGDKYVNCKNIVIGRDRETLHFGLLCGRRHKGCQLLPFDDGFSISRPRKGKGAAVAYPTVSTINPVQDYMDGIEKMLKKWELGKFAAPLPDYGGKFLNIEARLLQIEKMLDIKNDPSFAVTPIRTGLTGESGTSNGDITSPVSIIAPVIDNQEDNGKDIDHDHDIVVNMPVSEQKVVMKILAREKSKNRIEDNCD